MEFIEAESGEDIAEMSKLASAIIKVHFDPIIGPEQNDYMIAMFQSPEAIRKQIEGGCRYCFVSDCGKMIGFTAFRPEGDVMHLSKFYLIREARGRGLSHDMLSFIIREAENAGICAIELNVNKHNSAVNAYRKLGFRIIRSEINGDGTI